MSEYVYRYGSILYHSEIHARWAAFFDSMGVEFVYRYVDENTPCFYLPRLMCRAYVFPYIADKTEFRDKKLSPIRHERAVLAEAYAKSNVCNVILINGYPGASPYRLNVETFDPLYPTPHYVVDYFLGEFISYDHLPYFLQHMFDASDEGVGLYWFLIEQGYTPNYPDGSMDSIYNLIDLDRKYWQDKYGGDHPSWMYGAAQLNLAFDLSPKGRIFINYPDSSLWGYQFQECLNAKISLIPVRDFYETEKFLNMPTGVRLYDRLNALPDNKKSYHGRHDVVISANNVAEYVFETNGDVYQWNNQPTYRLPFTSMWIEMHRPETRQDLPYAWAMTVDTSVDRDYDENGNYVLLHDKPVICCGSLIVQWEADSIPALVAGFMLDLNDDWTAKRSPKEDSDLTLIPDMRYSLSRNSEIKYQSLFESLATACFTAITFMNCKNVQVVDNQPPKSISREYSRKWKQPLIAYKTINIEPKTLIHYLQEATDKTSSGKKDIAWHKVIGTFADYRHGKGLFGKETMREIYWKPAHIRGDVKNGIVIKDYNVLPK